MRLVSARCYMLRLISGIAQIRAVCRWNTSICSTVLSFVGVISQFDPR